MTKDEEIEMARKFFDHMYNEIEYVTDVVYEFIDPEMKYGGELCDKLNNYTIREVIALGFKVKYGVEWHEGKDDNGDK